MRAEYGTRFSADREAQPPGAAVSAGARQHQGGCSAAVGWIQGGTGIDGRSGQRQPVLGQLEAQHGPGTSSDDLDA
jgi:hypothetical protein